MKRILLISILLFISLSLAWSDDLQIEAFVDKTTIGVEDNLKLTIEISGEDANRISQPSLPEIEHLRLIGTSTSSSSSYSIINGRMESTVKRSYIYTLRPVQTGITLIPPISIAHKGATYTTKPISITIKEGSTEPSAPRTSPAQPYQDDDESIEANLFIITEYDKENVYLDEPITVSYKLYSQYDISNMSFGSEPNFTGFWKEDVYIPERINFRRTTYQGKIFNVMTLRSLVLFPKRSGNLEIPPLQMVVDIRTPRRSFFDFGSSRRYDIASKPMTITARNLPTAGRPDEFSGAVGDFDISASLSSSSVTVGDPITYTITIDGEGNFKHFDPPPIKSIENIRFIDPEISTELEDNKINGKKVVRYLIIAQEPGNFTIPAYQFNYFDPKSQSYRTIQTAQFSISVEPSDQMFIPRIGSQTGVRLEGSDIDYIITTPSVRSISLIYNSVWYWLVGLLILLTIPLAIFYSNEQSRMMQDGAYYRRKKANRILKKYLLQATKYAEAKSSDFYLAAYHGLCSYLADKLHIPRGSTTSAIIEALKSNKYPTDITENIQAFLEKCNQARFMPGGFSQQQIGSDYETLKKIVNDILKLKRTKK
jgi:hypothetical protein